MTTIQTNASSEANVINPNTVGVKVDPRLQLSFVTIHSDGSGVTVSGKVYGVLVSGSCIPTSLSTTKTSSHIGGSGSSYMTPKDRGMRATACKLAEAAALAFYEAARGDYDAAAFAALFA
jgi:hypothetical protein